MHVYVTAGHAMVPLIDNYNSLFLASVAIKPKIYMTYIVIILTQIGPQ